jgi:hypothetical protein
MLVCFALQENEGAVELRYDDLTRVEDEDCGRAGEAAENHLPGAGSMIYAKETAAAVDPFR